MRPSLVIGASGLVGEHLVNALTSIGLPLVATYRTHPVPEAEQLDISQPDEVSTIFQRVQPQAVFLPAALANVDYCETNQEVSFQTNVIGVKNVVEASNAVEARLIYFSTDYIFDGVSGPYAEDVPANPISEYGRQKLIAEHILALTSLNYLIIRTTVVYGWEHQGKNFVYRLVKSLEQGSSVRVPSDQIGTPTYAPELAHNAVRLSTMNIQGVVNIVGSDRISRYEFALETARVFHLPEKLIQPVTTKELNQPARRPLMAGLKTEKAVALLGSTPSSSSESLRRMALERG